MGDEFFNIVSSVTCDFLFFFSRVLTILYTSIYNIINNNSYYPLYNKLYIPPLLPSSFCEHANFQTNTQKNKSHETQKSQKKHFYGC